MTVDKSGSGDVDDGGGDDVVSMGGHKRPGVETIALRSTPVSRSNGYGDGDQKCLKGMRTNHRVDPESLSCED